MATFKSVDDYIAAQPESMRPTLEQVRAAIRKALPKADECIAYNMPAYRKDGRAVIFFAGWKKHYSLYPADAVVQERYAKELSRYTVEKGTIRFPWDDTVPVRLITGIAKLRGAGS